MMNTREIAAFAVFAGAMMSAFATTWYVDAENGNDSWNGKADIANANPANNIGPKKTLAVFTELVAQGDTIYAAPGWYTNGVVTSGSSNFRFCSTKGNISLVSTGSAADTFIGGAADETVAQDSNPYGCGPAAIVPVKMLGKNSVIRGFTLTGGRQSDYSNIYGGAAVFADGYTDSMIDCVVTNCIANRGGGAYCLGTALRCRFTGNYAEQGAHALYLKHAANCIFENTEGYAVYNNGDSGTFVNCLCRGNKGGNFRANPNGVLTVVNSVLLKGANTSKNKRCDFRNCLFDFAPDFTSAEAVLGTNAECRVFALGALRFNADGSPAAGNPAIDAGIASYYDENFPATFDASEKALDFYRNPRTVGGAMDIGAVERSSATVDENVWHVDAENGNDAWDGKASFADADPANNVGPKKTLGVFTDLVAKGDVIYAAPGWYTNGVSSGTNFRFYTKTGYVSLISTGSAADTFIGGAADETVAQDVSPFGCGPAAIVPIKMEGGGNLIRGFTVTGGRQTQYANSDAYYGGGVIFNSSAFTDCMIDCVVTNCIANRGGGVKYLGNALRCRFTGNYANEGAHGLYLRRAVNCIFENTQGYAVYNNSFDGTFVNCLCRDNKMGNFRTGAGHAIDVFNSVFLRGDASYVPRNKRCDFRNCCFDYDPTKPYNADEAMIGTNGECRVFATGTLKFNADGSPAKDNPVVDAGIVAYYDENFPSAFKASEKGLDLNGNARTLGDAMDIGAVERISGTIDDNTWYVDAVNGNDSNSGTTADQAFKTLARASTNALMTAGATIFVAEGVYNEGVVPAIAEVDQTDCRLYVQYRIDVVATGRREATIIEGASSQDTACGIGQGAVRCCLMRGGSIRGFTLRNGNVNVGDDAQCDYGGGIRSSSTESYAYDCEIYSCNAVRGGGAYNVKLVRCHLHDNTTVVTGVTPARSVAGSAVGAYSCSGYNSVIEGQCYSGSVFLNCTLPGRCWGSGTKFVNCYIGSDESAGATVAATFTNCVHAGTFLAHTPHGGCVENAATVFDKNWRPRNHESAIVNTADEALYAALFPSDLAGFRDLDFAGGPRVLEERMDIGAGEMLYDPKGTVLLFR